MHQVEENDNDHGQQNQRVACVIVTYNNASNIEELFNVLLNQSNPIAEIILVDNASSDGIAQMVKQKFLPVTVFVNPSNMGVGGGYAQGMEYAYKKGYNWTWLLDGDSVPHVSALEQLITAFVNYTPAHPSIGILASSPVNPVTGQIYGGFIRHGLFHKIPKEISEFRKPVSVDTVISSGSLISDKVIKDVGLPRADFFMDFVDAEYNLRVLRSGYEIVCVPDSIINHHVGQNRIIHFGFVRISLPPYHSSWRLYYALRNELYTYWHEFRCYRALFRLLLSTALLILEIILIDDYKVERVRYIFKGLVDGFKGRLGKTVLPPGEG